MPAGPIRHLTRPQSARMKRLYVISHRDLDARNYKDCEAIHESITVVDVSSTRIKSPFRTIPFESKIPSLAEFEFIMHLLLRPECMDDTITHVGFLHHDHAISERAAEAIRSASDTTLVFNELPYDLVRNSNVALDFQNKANRFSNSPSAIDVIFDNESKPSSLPMCNAFLVPVDVFIDVTQEAVRGIDAIHLFDFDPSNRYYGHIAERIVARELSRREHIHVPIVHDNTGAKTL